MADLLTDEQITTALNGLPHWQRDGDSVVRTAELAGFPQAIEVVNRVAQHAEAAQHHPDIDIRWRTVTFRLSTHSDGGITQKDIDLATQIDVEIGAAP
ncbi:MAG: 4a-hydroxytetrahydrobiopterin dehydratase [Sciscionella sp.]